MSPRYNRLLLPTLVSAVGAVLIVLAVMQYRWTTQVNEANEAQIGEHLESLMVDWHLDFYNEFRGIASASQISPDSDTHDGWKSYLGRYGEWKKSSRTPGLIDNVLIWETSTPKPRLMRLDLAFHQAQLYGTPTGLGPLLERLSQNSSNIDVALQAWKLPETSPDKSRNSSSSEVPGDSMSGWQFDQNVPALVHPIVHHALPGDSGGSADDSVDWLVVVLDMSTIQKQVLPELARRYFGGGEESEYQVEFSSGNTSSGVIYYSETQRGQNASDSDTVMNIFGPPPDSTEGHFWQAARNATAHSGPEGQRFTSPVWFPVIRYSALDGDWNLVLKHRKGSLSAMLVAARRRNLALSFGVLLLLAISMALALVASQRAQKLARLQMEFVASVSHELRTPLAVIRSAAENIADGVVAGGQQLNSYGIAIRNQTLQLTDLVEQVLLFASTREGGNRFVLRSLAPAEVIASAVNNTSELLRKTGIRLEQELQPNLPNINGDLSALSRCVQNLLVNAVKYGGDKRWIGIQARTQKDAGGSDEVQITVQDRGTGISGAELHRIFEAFYRSPAAVAAQIHGTGLGLALAKSVAEAMGGRLTVKSVLGEGSAFTLHLPAAGNQRPTEAPVVATSGGHKA